MHFPLPRHDHTGHVHFDARVCEACGACVEACPRDVLSVLPYRFHRHAHVDHPDRCRGCLRCVRACPRGAVRAMPARSPSAVA
jgi:ferredoxin